MKQQEVYKLIGKIEIPVYDCDGVAPPVWKGCAPQELYGLYVDKKSDYPFSALVLPQKQRKGNSEYDSIVEDTEAVLKMVDSSLSNISETVKTKLEEAVERILEKCSAEELIELKKAGLV